MDARQAQIEGRVTEYFAALGEQDYARAQQVCCTEEWRARYPLASWERNFAGVSDLRLVGAPRYLQMSDDVVVVDTDYTFVSGGARRNFTLRWTFKPVGWAVAGRPRRGVPDAASSPVTAPSVETVVYPRRVPTGRTGHPRLSPVGTARW